jgi:hypothetical protein
MALGLDTESWASSKELLAIIWALTLVFEKMGCQGAGRPQRQCFTWPYYHLSELRTVVSVETALLTKYVNLKNRQCKLFIHKQQTTST